MKLSNLLILWLSLFFYFLFRWGVGHPTLPKCVYIAYYPFHIMKDYKNIDNLVKA